VVTIAATSEGTKDERIEKAFFIVEPDRNQLIEIGKLVETGDLQLFVAAVIPFDQASAAYTEKLRQTRGRGKLVLEIAGAFRAK
jgi:NADPH:quinone reductase-like Zn-dependent oxidoreductase